MDTRTITSESLSAFERYLMTEERGNAAIEKYLWDTWQFTVWLGGQAVTKESVASWKQYLPEKGYDAGTVNSKLADLNAFFRFEGWTDCWVKSLKRQRQIFRRKDRELTQDEYN